MKKSSTKGFNKVAHNIKRLKENANKTRKQTFSVTYTAPYAVYVHEDLEAKHKNGQAKFLEQPLREHATKMSKMIRQYMRQGLTFRQAILKTGEWLLAQSQMLVPVDSGNLRDSGKVILVKQ